MAPTTESDQIAFLKCCFKHLGTKSGDIPMEKVVEEMDLPSVGAAKKRFERLLKGETGKKASAGDVTTSTKAKADKKPKTSEKRKLKEETDDEGDDENNQV